MATTTVLQQADTIRTATNGQNGNTQTERQQRPDGNKRTEQQQQLVPDGNNDRTATTTILQQADRTTTSSFLIQDQTQPRLIKIAKADSKPMNVPENIYDQNRRTIQLTPSSPQQQSNLHQEQRSKEHRENINGENLLSQIKPNKKKKRNRQGIVGEKKYPLAEALSIDNFETADSTDDQHILAFDDSEPSLRIFAKVSEILNFAPEIVQAKAEVVRGKKCGSINDGYVIIGICLERLSSENGVYALKKCGTKHETRA
eukprot:jgi/Psemu1/24711/gm1.24711_g